MDNATNDITNGEIISLRKSDPQFSPLLREIETCPEKLYAQGVLPDENQNPLYATHTFISIVGTRNPSEYGREQTKALVRFLAPYPIVIVSGLADGIDSIAHESALENQMITWAVIGCGHEMLRTSQRSLAERITKNGCILSEYQPTYPPQKENFPQRNRIIAGLSRATIVIEAPEKSGAKITARLAFEQNRDVFALTADIDNEYCRGNLTLIENHIAHPLTSHHMLIDTLGLNNLCAMPGNFPPKTLEKNLTEKIQPQEMQSRHQHQSHHQHQANTILSNLSRKKPTLIGGLMAKTRLSLPELLEHLTYLELKSLVKSGADGYIIIR